MTTCSYVPTIKIGFGRTVTDDQLNAEFEAIEVAMACLEAKSVEQEFTENVYFDYGQLPDPAVLDPANGALQLATVSGDTNISFTEPQDDDPNNIILLLANGGNGRFNFANGSAWTTDSQGESMDGKPWANPGTGGDFGAVVNCIHDGIGWLYMVYARLDIDFSATAELTDVYSWR